VLEALRAIFTVNLGVKRTERVLVFTDRHSAKEAPAPEDAARRERLRDIAMLAAETARGFAGEMIFYEYPATGSHGAEPPAGLWECAFGKRTVEALRKAGLMAPLLRKSIRGERLVEAEKTVRRRARYAVDAVVALSNYSTSHTAFRDFLTRLCGARYASMPLFDASMLEGSMNVDWKALARRTREVAGIVNRAEEVEVTAPNGTAIVFSKKGRKALADTGMLTRPGSFGNLPAGEVYLAPLEGTAEGSLVLEWAPTRELASPITLTVREGIVRDISGEDPYRDYLSSRLSERRENGNIAELGIGTNDRATRPDNILESEKIMGTVHMALGDNSSFGGSVKTPFHQDFVFFRPTVTLTDSKGGKTTLLKDGKLPTLK
jgi:leucyl aminopeptidase (aminopeptidase T)